MADNEERPVTPEENDSKPEDDPTKVDPGRGTEGNAESGEQPE